MLKSITTISVLIALIGLNLVSYSLSARFDFTENKIYTLSDSTKTIVSNLSDDLVIKVFLSNTLPPQVMSVKQSMLDNLSEYEALSGSKIDLEILDPAESESDRQLAQSLGIPELQLQIIQHDKQEVLKAYMGLAVLKEKVELEEDKQNQNALDKYEAYETIPVIQDLSDFEYNLTAAIKKISMQDIKTIGFLTGHDEHKMAPPRQQNYFYQQERDPRADYPVKEVLEKNYVIQSVEITEENPKIENIDTLVIAGAQKDLADYELKAIKDFVAEGNNLILLVDTISVDQMIAKNLDHNLNTLLSEWGVEVRKALLKDIQHESTSFRNGLFSFALPYPFWAKVSTLNPDNAITSRLPSFVLPWGSPLKITKKDGINIDILAKSSPYYALAEGEELVDVPVEEPKSEEETELKEESVTEEDKKIETKKEWQDKFINLNPQQEFGITRIQKAPVPLALIAQKENEGKVFVMGDSDFIVMTNFSQNQALFMNLIDSFTIGDELIAIRSKVLSDRPVGDLNLQTKNIIKWGNIILMPLLFITYGLVRNRLRVSKKVR